MTPLLHSDRTDPTLAPTDTVLDLLADSGGQLTERTLVTELPYPTASCRRVLAELEARGEVARSETGTETVVCLADAEPSTSA